MLLEKGYYKLWKLAFQAWNIFANMRPEAVRCTHSYLEAWLTNEHSLIYTQNDCFTFFFKKYIKTGIQVLCF